MAKETRLNETAEIYQPRIKQTEKQKLSEMTMKEKIGYFNQYYKYKVLGTLAALAFVIYILYTVFSPKIETVFYAAIVNNYMDSESADKFSSDFGKYLDLDFEKNNVVIDSSYFINDKDMSGSAMQSEQKLAVLVASQQIDVIIAPAEDFKSMAYYSYFDDLADQLPTDLYKHFTDKLYISKTEDDKDEKAFGIYLNNVKFLDTSGYLIKDPVLGIIGNSKYKTNSVEFIRYLFNIN